MYPEGPPEIDVRNPNAARMYDYALGGKDNYQADRDAVGKIIKTDPQAVELAWQNRAFLSRAVRHVAYEGVTQFIDVGSGLPTAMNTHQIADEVIDDIHVLYVDNDPVVCAHARALVTDNTTVRIAQADLREPDGILLDDELVRNTFIDFSQPVCLILAAILHFIPGEEAYRSVTRLASAMPSGSRLIISHGTADQAAGDLVESVQGVYDQTPTPLTLRSHDGIARFFTGFDIEPPGIVNIAEWPKKAEGNAPLKLYGGVGKKN